MLGSAQHHLTLASIFGRRQVCSTHFLHLTAVSVCNSRQTHEVSGSPALHISASAVHFMHSRPIDAASRDRINSLRSRAATALVQSSCEADRLNGSRNVGCKRCCNHDCVPCLHGYAMPAALVSGSARASLNVWNPASALPMVRRMNTRL